MLFNAKVLVPSPLKVQKKLSAKATPARFSVVVVAVVAKYNMIVLELIFYLNDKKCQVLAKL